MLKLYNSQTRQKEEFVPLHPETGQVGFYYCGPTVYDSLHLGHARAAIVPDMIRRYLEHKGYVVRYVANFTDVDDKIIKRALREDRSWREITVTYMDEYQRLMAAVGNRPVDVHPRATDHIPQMIDLVERLLDGGNAYVAPNGDVYFDTRSFDRYLALSNRKLEDQDSGRSGRVSDEELAMKKNAEDFILWKVEANDPDDMKGSPDRVPGWDSPWGRGRPGWHLECSALSRHYLGMPFDIHGGGRDLIFPHHENEKAQNDCAYCEELGGGDSVKYWMHNGFVTVVAETEAEKTDEHTSADGQSKMSKSLGNVKWLKDMIWPDGPYDPMAVRMLMLRCHYRSPLQFSNALLDQSMARVERIYSSVERLMNGLPELPEDEGEASEAVRTSVAGSVEAFENGMDDDFNTSRALAAVDELIQFAKSQVEAPAADRRHVAQTIVRLCRLLGLRAERPKASLSQGSESEEGLLHLLGDLRQEARASKNYAVADQIRDRLAELGFEIRDGKEGFEVARLK